MHAKIDKTQRSGSHPLLVCHTRCGPPVEPLLDTLNPLHQPVERNLLSGVRVVTSGDLTLHQGILGAPCLDGRSCLHQLEALEHDRKGQHSIRVNDQWRVGFRFEVGNAFDVELVDYH